jgi:hypothetical protein
MARFKIKYWVWENGEEVEHTVFHDFEDWVGRATDDKGVEFGTVMRISASQWAEDLAYSLADKGRYLVTEMPDARPVVR